MTTGTTTNLNENRTTIITDAMFLLGVQEAGETISDADMALAVRWLNRLVKGWEAGGMHVWTNAYATVFLEYGQSIYTLGYEAQGFSHWAEAPIEQSITADAIAAATTLYVDSSTLMTIGDHVGIVTDAGLLQWTTVASKPTATSITIAAPLNNPVTDGNFIYSYTAMPVSGAPLRILQANLKSGIGVQQQTIIMPGLAFLDFFQLTSKLQPSNPVNWSYQKNVNSGELRVWPNPNNVTNRIELQYTRPIFNFDQASDTQDIPDQWLMCLVYGLAVCLAPSYGKSQLLQTLMPLYQAYIETANTYDQEDVSIYMSPTQYRY